MSRGFDREKAGDPMFQSAEVAKAFGFHRPPSASDMVRLRVKSSPLGRAQAMTGEMRVRQEQFVTMAHPA